MRFGIYPVSVTTVSEGGGGITKEREVFLTPGTSIIHELPNVGQVVHPDDIALESLTRQLLLGEGLSATVRLYGNEVLPWTHPRFAHSRPEYFRVFSMERLVGRLKFSGPRRADVALRLGLSIDGKPVPEAQNVQRVISVYLKEENQVECRAYDDQDDRPSALGRGTVFLTLGPERQIIEIEVMAPNYGEEIIMEEVESQKALYWVDIRGGVTLPGREKYLLAAAFRDNTRELAYYGLYVPTRDGEIPYRRVDIFGYRQLQR